MPCIAFPTPRDGASETLAHSELGAHAPSTGGHFRPGQQAPTPPTTLSAQRHCKLDQLLKLTETGAGANFLAHLQEQLELIDGHDQLLDMAQAPLLIPPGPIDQPADLQRLAPQVAPQRELVVAGEAAHLLFRHHQQPLGIAPNGRLVGVHGLLHKSEYKITVRRAPTGP